ncbi:SPFH/Band 7/PHB domain-containing membrane-associated protein family isoform 3 [Hibiscus syriacus]|uniref:SPFH/Band 7/PHB domain-containing membrane-associated protein family isoform 3 n=1 Tax=Hibiscus syriacus TaxID=106335 RepID=A0A6A2YWZ0_HIBSY|nr:SPFH/Band 7/PHB domain-containing membrane-associated protein family isoform 3 [Hibiscus syriacus]
MHLSGEAEAILARAQATAKGIALVSQSLKENGGVEDSNQISPSTFMVSCISCDGIGKRVGIIVILINVKYSMSKSRKTSIILRVFRKNGGEAEAILARAQATAKGIALVSQSLKENGGVEDSNQISPSTFMVSCISCDGIGKRVGIIVILINVKYSMPKSRKTSIILGVFRKNGGRIQLLGEAEAILARAQATAKGIALVSQSLKENGGVEDSNKISPSSFMVSCISCDGIGKRVGIIVILINVKYSMPKSRKTSIILGVFRKNGGRIQLLGVFDLRFGGEAEAILARAQATAKGIALVSQSLKENGGVEDSNKISPSSFMVSCISCEAEAILARAQATAKGIALVSQSLKENGGVEDSNKISPSSFMVSCISCEAEAILARAQATAKGIALVSQSLKENGGVEDSNQISPSTFMVSCISCDGIGKRVGIIVILINVKYSMPKSRKTSIILGVFRKNGGEAEAILARAQATAKGIALVSQSLKENGGVEDSNKISPSSFMVSCISCEAEAILARAQATAKGIALVSQSLKENGGVEDSNKISPSTFMVSCISCEAEAILARAQATAKGIALVSQSLKENGGVEVRFFHHCHCEAEAILARAQATAKGIALVSQSLKENGGVEVRFFHHCHCEAEAILARAQATAKGIALVSQSLKENGGVEDSNKISPSTFMVSCISCEAEAILARAQATAKGIALVSQSLKENGGVEDSNKISPSTFMVSCISCEAEAILARAQATAKGIALVSQSLKENGGVEDSNKISPSTFMVSCISCDGIGKRVGIIVILINVKYSMPRVAKLP